MKIKQLMLVSLVLLAILMIGAVSASDDADFDEALTVDDVDEVSMDASQDDDVISEGGDEKVAASADDDTLGNSSYSDGEIVIVVPEGNGTVSEPFANVDVGDDYEGESITVDYTYYGYSSGYVNAYVDGKMYEADIADGEGTLLLSGLQAGEYTLFSACYNDDDYNFCNVTTQFTVWANEGPIDYEGIDLWIDTENEFLVNSDMEALPFAYVNVPDGIEGGIVLAVRGDESFQKDLDEFDEDDVNDNTYSITFGDVENLFDDCENGDVITLLFKVDDDAVASKDYKFFNNNGTIHFEEYCLSDDVELWIDTESNFQYNIADALGRIFATVAVPEGFDGFVSFEIREDPFFYKPLSECSQKDTINGTDIYGIALGDDDEFIFDYYNEEGFTFVVYDENENIIKNQDYLIFFENNTVRFELNAHNPGNQLNIDVKEFVSFEDEEDFVWVNLPTYVLDGKVKVTSEGMTLFEESVNFEEGSHWWVEVDGHYVCSFAPADLPVLQLLDTDDIVTFAFLDENDDVIESKDYTVTLTSDGIYFEESGDEIEVSFWDEDDERGVLYTDCEEDVVSVKVPEGFEGTIYISVNGDLIEDGWDIEFDEGEDFAYHGWSLYDLGIDDADEYEIKVIYQDDVIAESTLYVEEFNNDTFRAMILYADECLILYCPEGSEGTVTIITEKEIEDGELEFVKEVTHEITSDDYGQWIEWDLSDDLGFEADGAFRVFTLTVAVNGDESYWYRASHVDGENEEEDDVYEIELRFVGDDDEPMELEKASSVTVAYLLIPDTEDFEDAVVTVYVTLNGENFTSITTSDKVTPIALDLTRLSDKDVLVFYVDEMDDCEWPFVIEDEGDAVFFHDDYDPERLEFDVFRGNLTTGTTNDPELMGPDFGGNFVLITISDSLNVTEGTVTVSDGTEVIFSKSLSDCEKEFDYASLGYTYVIAMEEVLDNLPEGTNLTVAFNYGDESIVQKRIRFNDYLYKIVIPEDIKEQFMFEINDDMLLHENDTAISLSSDSNRQSIYIELGGGYFIIYVNGTKVENLGDVSFNTWKDESDWEEDEDYLRNYYPDEEAFLSDVRSYWGDELELFRLTSWDQGAPEIEITLADLGITESGIYNIRIVHYPSVPGGLDDHSALGIIGEYAEEMFIPTYTEVLNANITCNLDPDYAGVEIRDEVIYRNGIPFLINFQFGDNILSESNYVLVYVNGELAFNGTTLFYEENDDGEMELVDLWKLDDGEFNEELLNKYGELDAGEYEAVVYLVKGDDPTPVEIGRGNFTVIKQRGNMNFTMGTSMEYDGEHTVLYADIPEGDWDGYSLSINIDDSEEIYPNEDDWFARWYDEYVIFKDDEIYFKGSLEDIIGKGPVAIDLGVLYNGTRIWVEYGHGEETVFGDWDFYQDYFTVESEKPKEDPAFDVVAESVVYPNSISVNITGPSDANGNVNVAINDVKYTVTLVNGKGSLSVDSLNAGTYNVVVNYPGDDKYNACSASTNFTVVKAASSVSLSDAQFNYGDSIQIPVILDGAYSINVTVVDHPEAEIYLSVDDGFIVNGLMVVGLGAGKYTLNVITVPDENHYAVAATAEITINKINPNVTVEDSEFGYEDDVSVLVKIDAPVYLNATVVGHPEAEVIYLSDGAVVIYGLNAGVYTLNVVTVPDDMYNSVEANATITINKVDPIVTLEDIEFYYGTSGSTFVAIDAYDDLGIGDVSVVGHPEAKITIEENEITVSGLAYGSYTLSVVVNATQNYNSVTQTANITVNKVIVTSDNLSEYVDEDGKLICDYPELIFKGEFNGLTLNINKAVTLKGEDATFNNARFIIESDNVTIEGIDMNYEGDDSIIVADGVSNLNLIGNTIAFTGLAGNNKAVSITGCTGVYLINNNINANGTGYVHGIVISADDFTIGDNVLIVTSTENATGINIYGPSNGIVDNNALTIKAEKTVYSINTNPSTGLVQAKFTNNLINSEAFFVVGIYDESILIDNNTINLAGNYGIGVVVLSDGANVTDNVIRLNTSNIGSVEEIQDDNVENIETSGILVMNNATIADNTIESSDKAMTVVAGNSDISGNDLNGQVSIVSEGNTISGNVLNGEVSVVGDGNLIAENDLNGQMTIESNNNIISSNVVKNNNGHAIVLSNSASRNQVNNNELYSTKGNGNDAVSNNGANNEILNNRINPGLTIAISGFEEGSTSSIVIEANENFTGTVEVNITLNGAVKQTYTVSVENGSGNTVIKGLAAGTYTAEALSVLTDNFTVGQAFCNFTVTAKAQPAPAPAPVAPAQTSTPVAPAPAQETIKLTLKTVKVKKSAKKLVLQATLKINGKKVKGKILKFKFNGKTYKAKTNKNGIAKVTIKKAVLKKLKVGKKVKYQVSYNGKTVKKSAKIKK